MIDAWHQQAACKGMPTHLFFPEDGANIRKDVKAVCAGCEVRDACRDYALREQVDFGYWGGLSPRQRRQLRRGAHTVACSVCGGAFTARNRKVVTCSDECWATRRRQLTDVRRKRFRANGPAGGGA